MPEFYIIKYNPWLYNSLKRKLMSWGKFCTLNIATRPQEILEECLSINKKLGTNMYPTRLDEVEYVCRSIDFMPLVERVKGIESLVDHLFKMNYPYGR